MVATAKVPPNSEAATYRHVTRTLILIAAVLYESVVNAQTSSGEQSALDGVHEALITALLTQGSSTLLLQAQKNVLVNTSLQSTSKEEAMLGVLLPLLKEQGQGSEFDFRASAMTQLVAAKLAADPNVYATREQIHELHQASLDDAAKRDAIVTEEREGLLNKPIAVDELSDHFVPLSLAKLDWRKVLGLQGEFTRDELNDSLNRLQLTLEQATAVDSIDKSLADLYQMVISAAYQHALDVVVVAATPARAPKPVHGSLHEAAMDKGKSQDETPKPAPLGTQNKGEDDKPAPYEPLQPE